MAITPISVSASPTLATAAEGASTEAGSGFSGLFAQLMGGTDASGMENLIPGVPLIELPDTQDTGAIALWAQLTGQTSDGQGNLADRLQSLMELTRKRGSADSEEGATDVGILGTLQLPSSIPSQTLASILDGDASLDALSADGPGVKDKLSAFLGKAMNELGTQNGNSANLAAAEENHGNAQPAFTLNQALAAQHAAAAKGTDATNSQQALQSPVQSGQWAQEFGEKIVWMARQDQQQAQLSLNPAHLGPLQISLKLDADQASAVFTAATPEVRQAIEDAMPRLREMLASAGISLGQAQVGTQARQDAPTQDQPRFSSGSRSSGDEAILGVDATTSHGSVSRGGNGLVDLFA